jgi:acetate kinase
VRVLTVNAGSSSLKLRLLDEDDATLEDRELEAPRSQIDADEVREALKSGLGEADAVGHRIVHGGERFRSAARADSDLVQALRELTDLAPLHQSKSLSALEAVGSALPETPAVACFDTAFHATLAPEAATYALPAAWRARWPLRRFGFHGLSHAWIARRAPELLAEPPADLRIVSCHLGAGASLCAIRDGRSLDTTMGFTPLEGLVMATRSGSVDPGLVLWLLEHEDLGVSKLGHALEHDSGLLGLSGTADMRKLLDRVADDDETATLALDVYVHRLAASVAAMAVSLGGLDVLAFSGGVGEHAAEVRRRAADRLAFLAVAVDERLNQEAGGDADISAAGTGVSTVVVASREDLEMARQVRTTLGASSG